MRKLKDRRNERKNEKERSKNSWRVNEWGKRSRELNGVRKKGVKKEMGRFKNRENEKKKEGDSDREMYVEMVEEEIKKKMIGIEKRKGVGWGRKDSVVIERMEKREKNENKEKEEKIEKEVEKERFNWGGIGRRIIEKEKDKKIGRKKKELKEEENMDKIVRSKKNENGESEEREIGEEERKMRIVVNI